MAEKMTLKRPDYLLKKMLIFKQLVWGGGKRLTINGYKSEITN